MSKELHVLLGTGPVGCWIARALDERGLPTRAVNRSGNRPELMPAGVEMVRANAHNAAEIVAAAEGATVIYQALNPRYHQWLRDFPSLQAAALAAAPKSGARYISIENLYMYDSSQTMTENSPIRPRSKKGALRARMADEVMEAHRRGEIRAAALRSSDYYGPGVLGSALGKMVFGNLAAGKKAQLNGLADLPHSFAYIEDVGRAAVTLGLSEESLGRVWIAPHAPAQTQRALVEQACRLLGIKPQLTELSPLMMRMAGLFIPEARASVEMMYEFTEPFVADSSLIQRTFGLAPTPVEIGVERTVSWFRRHGAQG